MKKSRIIPTPSFTTAYHELSLSHIEIDDSGKSRTFFETHPGGNRQVRRLGLSKHHPFYTKSRHKGREWFQLKQMWLDRQ